MSDRQRSGHSIFGGLVLVLIGALFLVQNFHPEFDLWNLLFRWWPLLLILLGLARVIDYLLAQRSAPEGPAPRVVTGGDVFLIIAIIILVGVGAGIYRVHQRLGNSDFWPEQWGNPYVFTEQVSSASQTIPANARIEISDVRGDISVHAENTAQILVTVKKTVNEFSQSEAQSHADAIQFTVVDNHDGSFSIDPQQQGSDSRRMRTDLDVRVPLHASVTATTQQGNLDIADAGADVTASTEKGDVTISGAAGDVRLSGKGDEVSISNVKGEAYIDGEFYGPIRLSQIAKGARLSSKRTDFTISALPGSLALNSGNLEIENSAGTVSLTTQKNDVVIENISGSIDVDDHDGDIDVRLAQQPREPVNITDGSGNVSVTLPAQSNFQMDAESDSGNVDSEFPAVDSRKENDRSILATQTGAHGPMIRIRTTYGDIHLHKGS